MAVLGGVKAIIGEDTLRQMAEKKEGPCFQRGQQDPYLFDFKTGKEVVDPTQLPNSGEYSYLWE